MANGQILVKSFRIKTKDVKKYFLCEKCIKFLKIYFRAYEGKREEMKVL